MVRQGRASSYLVVETLNGSSTPSGGFKSFVESDVVTNGSRFEDLGQAVLFLEMKNPSIPASPTNFITLDSYRVTFIRADGRNTPGVDVPYPFDGAATGTVTDATKLQHVFVLVRAQAKLEAPLKALAGGGGAVVISTIAEVTLYGRDQAGNNVSVTGRISVNFADWDDS